MNNYSIEYNEEKDIITYTTPTNITEINDGMALLVMSIRLFNKISLQATEELPERY